MRVVTKIPILELWDQSGDTTATKLRTLVRTDVVELLRIGQIRIVIADCGEPLEWIPLSQCYVLWKAELKPRIVETDTFEFANFPGAYCYVASE